MHQITYAYLFITDMNKRTLNKNKTRLMVIFSKSYNSYKWWLIISIFFKMFLKCHLDIFLFSHVKKSDIQEDHFKMTWVFKWPWPYQYETTCKKSVRSDCPTCDNPYAKDKVWQGSRKKYHLSVEKLRLSNFLEWILGQSFT